MLLVEALPLLPPLLLLLLLRVRYISLPLMMRVLLLCLLLATPPVTMMLLLLALGRGRRGRGHHYSGGAGCRRSHRRGRPLLPRLRVLQKLLLEGGGGSGRCSGCSSSALPLLRLPTHRMARGASVSVGMPFRAIQGGGRTARVVGRRIGTLMGALLPLPLPQSPLLWVVERGLRLSLSLSLIGREPTTSLSPTPRQH